MKLWWEGVDTFTQLGHVHSALTAPPTVGIMALRELSSLEKYLGIKKPNKYSTQGDNKVIWQSIVEASTAGFKPLFYLKGSL